MKLFPINKNALACKGQGSFYVVLLKHHII